MPRKMKISSETVSGAVKSMCRPIASLIAGLPSHSVGLSSHSVGLPSRNIRLHLIRQFIHKINWTTHLLKYKIGNYLGYYKIYTVRAVQRSWQPPPPPPAMFGLFSVPGISVTFGVYIQFPPL